MQHMVHPRDSRMPIADLVLPHVRVWRDRERYAGGDVMPPNVVRFSDTFRDASIETVGRFASTSLEAVNEMIDVSGAASGGTPRGLRLSLLVDRMKTTTDVWGAIVDAELPPGQAVDPDRHLGAVHARRRKLLRASRALFELGILQKRNSSFVIAIRDGDVFVYGALRTWLEAGRQPGDALSTAVLAEAARVPIRTARRALFALREHGIVEGGGGGPFTLSSKMPWAELFMKLRELERK